MGITPAAAPRWAQTTTAAGPAFSLLCETALCPSEGLQEDNHFTPFYAEDQRGKRKIKRGEVTRLGE